MAIVDKSGRIHQYRGGRKEHVFIKVTYSELADLFDRSPRTIKRWVSENRFNPSSLRSIYSYLHSLGSKGV